MAKTYILEPMEITLAYSEATGANSYFFRNSEYTKMSEVLSLLTSDCILSLSDVVLKYAGTTQGQKTMFVFSPDGSMPAAATERFVVFMDTSVPLDSRIELDTSSEPEGTYTLSIYTETEDPEPTGDLTPITREEMYLSAIAGLTTLPSDMKPVTRKEMFLDAILNGSGGSVTPITREEMYLDAIANKE